jgi:hypothetical protein
LGLDRVEKKLNVRRILASPVPEKKQASVQELLRTSLYGEEGFPDRPTPPPFCKPYSPLPKDCYSVIVLDLYLNLSRYDVVPFMPVLKSGSIDPFMHTSLFY